MLQAVHLHPRGKPATGKARKEDGARTCCVQKASCTCICRNSQCSAQSLRTRRSQVRGGECANSLKIFSDEPKIILTPC